MTIAMGVVGNYPFALAAGLGINAIVAFTLTRQGLHARPDAMGVIVSKAPRSPFSSSCGLREAIMNAVPLVLKRSIGVGIGLFILFIGLVNGGLIVPSNPAMALAFPTTTAQFVFLLGLAITVALYALKVKASLIISIIVTTIIALIVGVSTLPSTYPTPSFATFNHADWYGALFGKVEPHRRPADDLRRHAQRLLRHDGHRHRRSPPRPAWPRKTAPFPESAASCFVDSLAAFAGGWMGVSSNTTYIESAAGVAEGGRTGFASIITGLLFLRRDPVPPLARHRSRRGDRPGPGPGRLPDVHPDQGHRCRATSRTACPLC